MAALRYSGPKPCIVTITTVLENKQIHRLISVCSKKVTNKDRPYQKPCQEILVCLTLCSPAATKVKCSMSGSLE